MRVLIAIPCLLRGGTEMQTLMLVRALAAGGYSVLVCCYFEADPEIVMEFRTAGAEIALLAWSRTITPASFVRAFATVIRRERPDIVHVQYMAPGLLPIIAARLAGMRNLIATVHQPATPYHGRHARSLLRFGASLCRCFICVSGAVERSWFGSSALFNAVGDSRDLPRHCTIQNAVEVREVERILMEADPEALRRSLGLDGRPVIGAVSRLGLEKGVDTLIECFGRFIESRPRVRLLLVGDGPERPRLQEQAKRLGVSGSIIWAGRQPWSRAIALMGTMDIVAVPSRFEGFGLTAAEAMACGKPVVASDVHGLRELLDDGRAGLLVTPGRPESLAEACLALLDDDNLRMRIGACGKERIKVMYDLPIFARRYRALYQRLANGSS